MSRLKLAHPFIKKIIEGPRALEVVWEDGHLSTFHYMWLRDNSPQSRDANGQRFHDIFDIPEDIHPWSVKLPEEGGVEILWAHAEHRSYYSPGWLRAHCYSAHSQTFQTLNNSGNESMKPELWSGKVVNKPMLTAGFEEVVMNAARRRDWVESLKCFGVGILKGVGVKCGDLEPAVKMFGIIRETHQGRIFDVKSIGPTGDNASAKGSHHISNSMSYLNPMPELQVFHCLSTTGQSPECTLVDGYLVSGLLRRKQPGMFLLLSSYPIPFLWTDSQHCFFMGRTTIDTNYRGETASIHFRHRSTGPFHVTSENMESYYKAYRTFADMLHDSRYQLHLDLEPGDVLVFDNSRVLCESQGAFSNGVFRLQGCYASWEKG